MGIFGNAEKDDLLSRMRVKEIIVFSLIVLIAVVANLPREYVEHLGVDRQLLFGVLGSLVVIALFLYALLPIVRNTHAGLHGVGTGLSAAALALGLTRWQTLRHVQLPLAAPTLLAGVQTAATINVGTATMAAFIGAGGYGERIVTGLALNDHAVLLSGAVPAALLALVVQGGFEGWLRWRHGAAGRP